MELSWQGVCILKQAKSNAFTSFFFFCPVETVENLFMMALIFYLANSPFGELAGCSKPHSMRDFPFEIDHNIEVWSCTLNGILVELHLMLSLKRDF